MRFQALLFDLYGTLSIPDPDAPAGMHVGSGLVEIFRDAGVDVSRLDPDTIESTIWRFGDWAPHEGMTLYEARVAGCVSSLTGCGIAGDTARLAADLVCTRRERRNRIDPAAVPLLTRLKNEIPLGLVSNFDHPPHIHRLLDRTGLGSLFDTVVISGDVGISKPNPEILHVACRHLNVDPCACAYTGDSTVDAQAATAAGMSFFWIHRPELATWMDSETKGLYKESDDALMERVRSGRITLVESLEALTAHLDIGTRREADH